jgi:hypothetical protein
MKLWSWFLYAGQRTFSRSGRNWWTGIGEVGFSVGLALVGFVLLVASLTVAASNPRTFSGRELFTDFGLRLLAGLIMVMVGFYRMRSTLNKVTVSVEQRSSRGPTEAESGATNRIELANELAGREPDLPAIPLSSRQPVRGQRLRYEVAGAERSLVWLILAGLATFVSFGLLSGMVVQAWESIRSGRPDWFAIVTAGLFLPAAVWAAFGLSRQLFRLAGFGPARLEISGWPVRPGGKYRLILFQPGRLRLKLLEVVLLCQEEATFSQGTSIQTERKTVFEQRLLRQRGVEVGANRPFECELELHLPDNAMHSFSSANNRVLWKIIVQGSARGWPDFQQTFPIVVHPTVAAAAAPETSTSLEKQTA